MGDYLIPLASPLDTLVGKTSSSRRRPTEVKIPVYPEGSSEDAQYPDSSVFDAHQKRPDGNPPQSPLLHTRFRASVVTQSSFNTTADYYGHSHARMASGTQDIPFDDDVSVYSAATSSFPISGRLSNVLPPELEPVSDLSDGVQGQVQSAPSLRPNSRRSKSGTIDPDAGHEQRSRLNISVPLPIVVVSGEEPEDVDYTSDQGRGDALSSSIATSRSMAGGRTPSTLPKHLNFSRPVRPVAAPEDSKRLVLARNAFRRSALPHSNPQSPPQSPAGVSPHRSRQFSPLQEGLRAEAPLAISTSDATPPSSLTPSMILPIKPRGANTTDQPLPLFHDPPQTSSSRSSLYSTYSYYQLDSPSDPPSNDTLQVPASPHTPPTRTPSPLANIPALKNDSPQIELADQLLQEGIQHHEANRLREAAIAFERSAKTPGGSGVGMLMWGLTLRHGWGCPKDESLGFSWLRRAAEVAVGDLEQARVGHDVGAVHAELVLAIYEVGQCFFHGWGVKKDQKMAVVSQGSCSSCVLYCPS
jgi:hypothetical protein